MKAPAKSVTAIICSLFFWCAYGYAQTIYIWVDLQGSIHQTTLYEEIPREYRNQIAKPPLLEIQRQGSTDSKRTWQVVRSALPDGMGVTILKSKCRNEPNGFGGIRWEANISQLEDMDYHGRGPSGSEITYYRRKGDLGQIGPAKPQSVVYIFWKGRLAGVLLTVEGSSNWDALRQACFGRFGTGDRPHSQIEEYVWDGNTTEISLRYSGILDKGKLYLSSKEITNEMKQYQKQKSLRIPTKRILINLIP
jgi:hypothetical protein